MKPQTQEIVRRIVSRIAERKKPIRCWNVGDPSGRGKYSLAIGAHSAAHAARLIAEAIDRNYSTRDLKMFGHEIWGTNMTGIEPAIGVWKGPRFGGDSSTMRKIL